MKVINKKINLNTRGDPELVNITGQVSEILDDSGLKNGAITVFVSGSTAAITSFEYEPGLVKDVQELFDKLITRNKHYNHDQTWGDANGFSHLRAALLGASLTVPFEDGKLLLGTWQQLVLAEFDNRPRKRQIIVQLIGE